MSQTICDRSAVGLTRRALATRFHGEESSHARSYRQERSSVVVHYEATCTERGTDRLECLVGERNVELGSIESRARHADEHGTDVIDVDASDGFEHGTKAVPIANSPTP